MNSNFIEICFQNIFLILGVIEDGNQTENAEEKTWEGAYGYEFLTL